MSIYEEIHNAEKSGKPCAVCTIIRTKGTTPRHTGSKMLVYSDGKTLGSIGGGLLEQACIKDALGVIQEKKIITREYDLETLSNNSRATSKDCVELLIEPIFPKLTVIILGAGHVGKHVAHLAKWLGYKVVVIDERIGLCNSKNIPDADELIVSTPEEALIDYAVDSNTYFVLTTRNVEIDIKVLPLILKSPAKYIGILGSKNRWKSTVCELINIGINEIELLKINSPIGIEINAESPEEIAISIMGQIIQKQHDNVEEI